MQRLKTFIRQANVILILATFCCYLSPYINPTDAWVFAFFGMAFPLLLILNFLFSFFWILYKKWYFLLSLSCIILGWNYVTTWVGLSILPQESSIHSSKIMTYNLNSMRHFGEDTKTQQDLFFQFIKQERPNILCLQEFTFNKKSTNFYLDGIEKHTGVSYYIYQSLEHGLAIISKYPINNGKTISFEKTKNGFIFADIMIDDRPFRVYNMHLQSNKVSDYADEIVVNGDLKTKDTWKNIGLLFKRVKTNIPKRSQQALVLANHMKKSPHPLLLCGDMNEPSVSYTYRQLSKGLTDSFQEKGFGLGTTYTGNIPTLRIDYILTPPETNVIACRIFNKSFSDHFPIISTIDFN